MAVVRWHHAVPGGVWCGAGGDGGRTVLLLVVLLVLRAVVRRCRSCFSGAAACFANRGRLLSNRFLAPRQGSRRRRAQCLKILIANRGEIACVSPPPRLGVKTVAVYSDADAQAKRMAVCDEAVHIGGSAWDSYLRWERIIDAAKATARRPSTPATAF